MTAVSSTAKMAAAGPALERSESISSSTTVQPSNYNGSLDTASSSTSQATSSTHDAAPKSPKRDSTSVNHLDDPLRSPPYFEHRERPGVNGNGRNPLNESPRAKASLEKFGSPFGTPRGKDRRWNDKYSRVQDDDDVESAAGEQVAVSKESNEVDEVEAKRIQQNLEAWAAKERLRRKASRQSGGAASPGTGRLVKRLSVLGERRSSMSPSVSSPPVAGPIDEYGSSDGQVSSQDSFIGARGGRMNGSSSRENSNSTGSLLARGGLHEETLQEEPGSGPEGHLSPMARQKGKARDMSTSSDPFRDPSAGRQYPRIKPRPGMPIVTPGRAPTIRHRAIEQAEASGMHDAAPSIVATDTEAEYDQYGQRMASNPFQSAEERSRGALADGEEQDISQLSVEDRPRSRSRQYPLGTTILDGAAPTASQQDKAQYRKSTSSRFNEVGLHDDGDAGQWRENSIEARNGEQGAKAGQKWEDDYHMQYGMQHSAAYAPANGSADAQDKPQPHATGSDTPRDGKATRQRWWSEWFCGLSAPRDEEQSGRTMPE